MKQVFFLAIITLVLYETSAKVTGPKSAYDLEKRLRDLTESEELVVDRREACSVQFVKVGCYRDDGDNRVMPEMLVNDRGKIGWANFESYLNGLSCRCAKAAKEKGYTHFGLQFYGECFSSPNAGSSYKSLGNSNQCIAGDYQPCDPQNEDTCVGGPNTNFVYEIQVEGSGEGSG